MYVDGHVKRNSTVPPSCPGPTCHLNNHSMPASTFRPGGTGSTGPLFVVSRMACCRVGRYSRANPSTTPCPSLHSGVPLDSRHWTMSSSSDLRASSRDRQSAPHHCDWIQVYAMRYCETRIATAITLHTDPTLNHLSLYCLMLQDS